MDTPGPLPDPSNFFTVDFPPVRPLSHFQYVYVSRGSDDPGGHHVLGFYRRTLRYGTNGTIHFNCRLFLLGYFSPRFQQGLRLFQLFTTFYFLSGPFYHSFLRGTTFTLRNRFYVFP